MLGPERRIAVLSGPTFAREVGAGLPTAMTIASPDAAYAQALARRFALQQLPRLLLDDILGVEIGGAVKNVLAVSRRTCNGLELRRQHPRRPHPRAG